PRRSCDRLQRLEKFNPNQAHVRRRFRDDDEHQIIAAHGTKTAPVRVQLQERDSAQVCRVRRQPRLAVDRCGQRSHPFTILPFPEPKARIDNEPVMFRDDQARSYATLPAQSVDDPAQARNHGNTPREPLVRGFRSRGGPPPSLTFDPVSRTPPRSLRSNPSGVDRDAATTTRPCCAVGHMATTAASVSKASDFHTPSPRCRVDRTISSEMPLSCAPTSCPTSVPSPSRYKPPRTYPLSSSSSAVWSSSSSKSANRRDAALSAAASLRDAAASASSACCAACSAPRSLAIRSTSARASAFPGCRSSPCCAIFSATASCPCARNASASWRNTRLFGSRASSSLQRRISSAIDLRLERALQFGQRLERVTRIECRRAGGRRSKQLLDHAARGGKLARHRTRQHGGQRRIGAHRGHPLRSTALRLLARGDDARRCQTVRDLGDLELVASERDGDAAQIALA